DLAQFIKELHTIDASDGPIAGQHNFYRGGDLAFYHDETLQALEQLQGTIDVETCKSIWDRALETKWEKEPVWVHGDLAVDNIIVQNERLYGVVDCGCMGTGDSAFDLVNAWTFFDSESRAIFMNQLELNESTWKRAKGWALWKALITYDQALSQKVIKILTQNE